jgi:hypothetical protein
METTYSSATHSDVAHPVDITVPPQLHDRNRLTCFFRPILAIPHIILVGGPLALAITWLGQHPSEGMESSAGGGVLGAVAIVVAIIAWFSIVFTGRFPLGLWKLSAFYLHWRVRAIAYLALLRDEYPPFGDGAYPARLELPRDTTGRNQLTVAFRLFLVIPHIIVLWFVNVAWIVTTIIAWFNILFTANYPERLYAFATGVIRWNTRVEAYLLLLRDEYPPFSLEPGA